MLRMVAVSFALGFLAVGLVMLCFAFGLAIVADVRGWGSFGIGSGTLTIYEYRRVPGGTGAVIDPGTVAVALLAGVLNAAAGAMLWSRMPSRR